MDQASPEVIEEMRAWVAEYDRERGFPIDAAAMSDEEVLDRIDQHYGIGDEASGTSWESGTAEWVRG